MTSKKRRNKIYTMSEDNPLWAKQKWDTASSFKSFVIYLQLPGKRSVNTAYRQFKGTDDKKLVAPSNWRRWSQGRDNHNERIKVIVVDQAGNESIRHAPTWKERAADYDDHLSRAFLEADWEKRRDIYEMTRKTTIVALQKTLHTLTAYQPTGQERLSEIASMMKTVNGLAQSIFGTDQIAQEDYGISKGDGKDSDSENLDVSIPQDMPINSEATAKEVMTQAQAMQDVVQLLGLAKMRQLQERNEAVENEPLQQQ